MREELPGLVFTMETDGSLRIASQEKLCDPKEVVDLLKGMIKRSRPTKPMLTKKQVKAILKAHEQWELGNNRDLEDTLLELRVRVKR